MAGAEDITLFGTVLHRAIGMRADRVECLDFAAGGYALVRTVSLQIQMALATRLPHWAAIH